MKDTLIWMFQESLKKYPEVPCFLQKKNGHYRAINFREAWGKIYEISRGLLSLGVRKGDRVAILSENCIEWALIDMAIIHIGAINVAIYTTLPPEQMEYILSDSGAGYIFVQDIKLLEKLKRSKRNFDNLRVIMMGSVSEPTDGILDFETFLGMGSSLPLDNTSFDRLWMDIEPDEPASIIYTSGTTGEQKGAVLTHYNFISNVSSCKDVLVFKPGEIMLSVLPLSHVFGRLVEHYLTLSCGTTGVYVENLLNLRDIIREVKPHYMCVVPRVLELFNEGLSEAIDKEKTLKKIFLRFALSIDRNRNSITWNILNRIIFKNIRIAMGLGRLIFFISGGAALKKEIAQFFYNLGITVLEGYGLTETSPVISVNRPKWIKFGTVGKPLKDVDVRIAEDGEILVKGQNVMKCYYNKPDETLSAIDPDGWFHTGDVGEIDSDGFLKITDRKKDIIVLANGKKVAPQPVEARLKESPYISEAVLFGDENGRISAVVVPDFKRLQTMVKEQKIDTPLNDVKGIVRNKEIVKLIRNEISRLTNGFSDFEHLHRLYIMDREFSVETGEMTPTMKVKRHMVKAMFSNVHHASHFGKE